LAWLRKLSSPAPAELRRLAGEIQIRLKVRRTVVVRVSGAVASPFVCGLFQPVIILPLSLADELPPGELTALLSHEFAHLRQHDLYWCVGWRWFTAVFWFHPLVWNIPAAHNLACEQEADRMASGQMAAQEFYAPMLA
jgi:beta-lactamase regulating signal transducer with metallopeptidase domain